MNSVEVSGTVATINAAPQAEVAPNAAGEVVIATGPVESAAAEPPAVPARKPLKAAGTRSARPATKQAPATKASPATAVAATEPASSAAPAASAGAKKSERQTKAAAKLGKAAAARALASANAPKVVKKAKDTKAHSAVKDAKPARPAADRMRREKVSILASEHKAIKALRGDLHKIGRSASRSKVMRAALGLLAGRSADEVANLVAALPKQSKVKKRKKK